MSNRINNEIKLTRYTVGSKNSKSIGVGIAEPRTKSQTEVFAIILMNDFSTNGFKESCHDRHGKNYEINNNLA